MHKHGAHGVCEQKDRRGAVRGQLSILRQLVDTFIQEETKKEQEQHVQMVEYLRGVSVFDEVSESILHAIADDLQVEKYSEGQIILKKGDPGTTFFLIKDGTVGFSLQVTNAAEVRLSTLMAVLHVSTPVSHGGAAAAVRWQLSHTPGGLVVCAQDDGKMQKTRKAPEFFGEISLLSEDNLVTATAIAKTDCGCYVLQVRPRPTSPPLL